MIKAMYSLKETVKQLTEPFSWFAIKETFYKDLFAILLTITTVAGAIVCAYYAYNIRIGNL